MRHLEVPAESPTRSVTPVHIPPFLHLIEEVTDDPNYHNATIAQQGVNGEK